jgi:ABC-type glycerol-3-phosphate transport system substrate-binding protein
MKLSILMKSGFLGILIVSLSVSYVGAQAGRFQEVLNAAKKEAASSALVVYASNPREEKTRQALFDAFKKKYGMPDFKFEWLELHPSVAVPRTITEIKAGRPGPTVLMSSASTLLDLDHAGYLDSFDSR